MDFILKNKYLVGSTVVIIGGGILLALLQKNRNKYAQKIKIIEQQAIVEQISQEFYSIDLVSKIQSLNIEMNSEKYEKLVTSNRKQRRAIIESDVNEYLNCLVSFNSQYSQLIDEQSIFTKSKVLSQNLYKDSVEVIKNNQKLKEIFRQQQQRDIIQLKQSIPSKVEGFQVQDAIDVINYMLGIISTQAYNFKDIINAIIQREDTKGLIYGIISQILYDFLQKSDKFQNIEEEDIFRFINSDNKQEQEIVFKQFSILTRAIFNLIEYIQQMKV